MKLNPFPYSRTNAHSYNIENTSSHREYLNKSSNYSVDLKEIGDDLLRDASQGSQLKKTSIWQMNPIKFSILGLAINAGLGISGCSSSENESVDIDSDGGEDSDLPPVEPNICEEPSEQFVKGSSPFQYNVLFVMDKSIHELAISKNVNKEEFLKSLLFGLNDTFNGEQLQANFKFSSVGTVYLDSDFPRKDTLEYHGLIYPEDTSEKEDVVVVLSKVAAASYFDTRGAIRINHPDPFSNLELTQSILIHEMGHFRGAIDLYNLSIGGSEFNKNRVYPGDHYDGNSIELMGKNEIVQWEDISIELINEAGKNPARNEACASLWLKSWEPEKITIKALDKDGTPLNGRNISIYRRSKDTDLTEDDKWHSDISNLEGIVGIPPGLLLIENSDTYFTNFLFVINHNNQKFLNWINIEDIVVPFRKGIKKLEIPIFANDETKYLPSFSDLEVTQVQSPPAEVLVGESIPRQVTIINHGPEDFTGKVTVQFWISKDSTLSNLEDKPFGGADRSVAVDSQGTINIDLPSLAVPSLNAGVYYLIAKASISTDQFTDPDSSNNILYTNPPFEITDP